MYRVEGVRAARSVTQTDAKVIFFLSTKYLFMKNTKKSENTVLKYCSRYQLDRVRFICEYNGWLTYNVSSSLLEGRFCGYPSYVFLRNDLKCRFANQDEVMEIMKIEAKNFDKQTK
jgi:hypothetical protein